MQTFAETINFSTTTKFEIANSIMQYTITNNSSGFSISLLKYGTNKMKFINVSTSALKKYTWKACGLHRKVPLET